jgi:hypothetical protein
MEVAEAAPHGLMERGLRFQSPDADRAPGGRVICRSRGVAMTTTPDEPTELELLHRLMTSSPPFTPLERAVELVVGGLPAALVDEVPLPSGGRLVGSQLTSHQGRLSELQVVLDVRGSTAEALRACERELRERGWDPVEDLPGPMHHGGFVSGAAGDTRMLRRGGQGPILWVAAGTIDETLTDLRVRLDWQMPRHLEERGGRGMQLPSLNRMPRLHPPKGVAMEPRGGAGGVGWFSSQGQVGTDLSVPELEAHFASQLVEAGWTRVSGRADEVLGWSSWSLPGEGEWGGLLIVLAAFGTRERSLILRVEEIKAVDGGSDGQGLSFGTKSAHL